MGLGRGGVAYISVGGFRVRIVSRTFPDGATVSSGIMRVEDREERWVVEADFDSGVGESWGSKADANRGVGVFSSAFGLGLVNPSGGAIRRGRFGLRDCWCERLVP
jgi:hypothetical protein